MLSFAASSPVMLAYRLVFALFFPSSGSVTKFETRSSRGHRECAVRLLVGQDIPCFADIDFDDVLTYRYDADADSDAADHKSLSHYCQLPSTRCLFKKVFERNTGLYAYMKGGAASCCNN